MTDDSLPFDEKLELRSWGLPDYILQKYLKRGIQRMFPWQVECLMSENVLLGGNLIYSAPTSAGKTLVAEILALKTVLERKKKVIIILPFVSVVREKMIYFQDVLCGSGIRVEGFMGSYNPPGGFKNVHFAVCTIEKANNLINRMLEEKNFDDVGCIVVDELHLLGDPHRGYLLELLLTKLKYVCQKGMSPNIQIVGMSATLPNLDLLANWLNATLYHTEFRPIPLYEYLKVGKTVFKSPELKESFELQTVCHVENDPGDVISICLDTIIKGYSILVFCPSKNWCETLAVQISTEIKRLGNDKGNISNCLRNQLNSRGIFDTLEQLKKCPAGLEKNLARSVAFGVAYHHAGLTLDERDIVEGGFRQSIIRVLVATSTLSAGVNLPARRVIIRSPAFQGHCMDILTYKQMIGRAGRMGKDTAGESYLICTETDVSWGKQLVTSALPPVESCLGLGDLSNSLKRALLEVIAGGVVTSSTEVEDYTKCTLLAASVNDERIQKAIESCTNYLKQNEFIKVDEDGGVLPSSLAEACLSSSVPPDQALYLLRELHKARQCFVLDSDLHAIYQVTPYSICDSWNVEWMRVYSIWENLPNNLQKIGDLIGVEDRFLIRAMRNTININADEHAHKVSIHKRFYTSLALQDLINEVPLNDVATKYGCTKGMLQSLQQSASTFAAMVTSFCHKLGWGGLEVLLSELSARIQFGVQKELLDLLRLECMTSHMARSLYSAGVTTLSELASASIQNVQLAINKAKPFQSEIITVDTQVKKDVYLPGRPGLSEKEAADLLIYEARRFLLKEMGVKTAEWEDSKTLVNDSLYESSTVVDGDSENKPNSSIIEAPLQTADNCQNKTFQVVNMNLHENIKVTHTPKEDHIKCGKSDEVELNLNISGPKELADTVIMDSSCLDLDISKINRIDDPEELARTFVPESQEVVEDPPNRFIPINDDKEISLKEPNENLLYFDFKVPNAKCVTNHQQLCDNPSSMSISESINFPNFELNAKLCSTYLQQDKTDTQKFSMEPLCGSPNKSDADFMDSIFENILIQKNSPACRSLKFSTPTGKTSLESVSNTSNNDLFSESPVSTSPIISKSSVKNQDLEEFDSNWGGDSLLELSQNFEKHIENIQSKTTSSKRRLIDFPEESVRHSKRIRLSNGFKNIKYNDSPDVKITHSFGDSFEFNTQLEDMAKINEKIKGKSVCKESEVNNILSEEKTSKNSFLESVNNLNMVKVKAVKKIHDKKCVELPNKKSAPEKVDDKSIITPPKNSGLTKTEGLKNNIPAKNNIIKNHVNNLNKHSTANNNHELTNCEDAKNVFQRTKSDNYNIPQKSVSLKLSLPRPKSEADLMKHPNSEVDKHVSALTDTVLVSAFDGTFKLTDIIQDSEDVKDSLEDIHISDSEDLINGSPEHTQKSRKDLTLYSTTNSKTMMRTLSNINSPIKTSPKSSPSRHSSPLKYGPIGHDILKIYKSPSRQKNLPLTTKTPESSPQSKNKLMTMSLPQEKNVVFDVFASGDNISYVIEAITKLKEVVFVLKTKTINNKETQQCKIGGRIVRNKKDQELIEPQFKIDDEALISIYLYGGSTIYHFNMLTIGPNDYRMLKNLFNQRSLRLCGLNLKSQMKLFYKFCGYIISCKIFDFGVADWLLVPEERSKNLEDLASEYLKPSQLSPIKSKNDITSEMILMWTLRNELFLRMQKANLLKHFEDIEMPVQLDILYMELTGIGFVHEVANELWSLSTELMGKLEMDAFSLANHKFALNSNSDLSKVKKELKISSEDEADHPLIIKVQNWRKLFSLKTRNLSQLLFKKDSRCYCRSSSRSVTGRIMMHDPDLQHIPRDFYVDDKLFSLRSAFVASKGNTLVSADYSQLELRILAHLSQDPILVPLLRKGDDVFKNIAAEWNEISVEKVTDDLRHQVKQLTYGIIYGMGDKALGEALGKTAADASMLSARFKRSFPKLEDFVKNTIEECRLAGKIKTLSGRVRHLPGINSSNLHVKAQSERQAVNSKIQGSASDIAKKALVEIENNLNRKFPGRSNLPSSLHTSHLVLQLHDEFIYEVEDSLLKSFIPILRDTMETSTFLSVPLPVVVKTGKSWGQMKPV